MQKNNLVWLAGSCLAAMFLLNGTALANPEPLKDQELLPGTPVSNALPTLSTQPKDDHHLRKLSQERNHAIGVNGPWLAEEGLSRNSEELIRAIQNASVHGLNPESYGLSQILQVVDSLPGISKPTVSKGRLQRTAASDYRVNRTNLSVQMDTAFERLAMHLGQGVVNARTVRGRQFRDAPQINVKSLLDSIWNGQQSASQALDSVTPAHAEYQRLTKRMRNLLTERATGIERSFIGNATTLSASMHHDDVLNVKNRLVETGDLPPTKDLTPYFDTALIAGLKQFQRKHGLEADGTVGQQTREALNLSIDDEITAVALSLERWRWMPRNLGQRHLYINIPDFQVVVQDGQETKLSMPVVVGAVEHQTPTFSRDMSYIEFNPTWTVPKSIANEELIPRERRQPGYLRSRQFDFVKLVNNEVVALPPDTVTMADLQTEPFPYTLRQRGGPDNDLGRMKFMMPNPYAIYLHDTQAKHHFSLEERAYSHGCIRLSNPEALATLLLTEDGYSNEYIQQALQNPDTHKVSLQTPLPTHLTYMTTWIDAAGALQRRTDVYQYDPGLVIALQNSDTLLSTLKRSTTSMRARIRLASNGFHY